MASHLLRIGLIFRGKTGMLLDRDVFEIELTSPISICTHHGNGLPSRLQNFDLQLQPFGIASFEEIKHPGDWQKNN